MLSGCVRSRVAVYGWSRRIAEKFRRRLCRPDQHRVQPQAMIDMSATAQSGLIPDTRKDDAHVRTEEGVINLSTAGEEAST